MSLIWAMGRDNGLALGAESFDAELHDITGFQPHLRPQTHADSGGRAGIDQVARFEHQKLAEIVNDEVGIEDHRRRRPILAADTTYVEPHPQVADIADLVRGGEPRPGWIEGLGRLALRPLSTALGLEGSLSDIVHQQAPRERARG